MRACCARSWNQRKLRASPAMCPSSSRNCSPNAARCHPEAPPACPPCPAINIIANCTPPYILYSIEIMQNRRSSPKDALADTAASFFNNIPFEYRAQEPGMDFQLLRESQRQRVVDLFRHDPFFTEEKLLGELKQAELENTQFIHTLLEELSALHKKHRNTQIDADAALRNKNTEGRKLAEHNVELTAALQSQRAQWKQERTALEQKAREEAKVAKSLRKEGEGLRKLLEEYEGELQKANARIEQLTHEAGLGSERAEVMVDKIDHLNCIVAAYEAKLSSAAQQIQQLTLSLQASQQAELQLQETENSLAEAQQISQNWASECDQLKQQQSEQLALISHLEMKLLEANAEVVRQEAKFKTLNSVNAQDAQRLIERENQLKALVHDLDLKAKLGMAKLKETYDKKLRKIATYFLKEIKSLKSSLNATKESLQKEMLLSCKLLQRDLKESLVRTTPSKP